jgi:hypothetical protein
MDNDTGARTPTTPSILIGLAGDIRVAREEVEARRRAPVDPPRLLWARQTLLSAMELYARELTARRLPVPRRLHDDLRLQRHIRRQPPASGWDRRGGRL